MSERNPLGDVNEPVKGYPGWTTEKCYCHAGIVANAYGEPTECRDCNGGVVFVSPKGAYAMYPGGPFLGRRGGKWIDAPTPEAK